MEDEPETLGARRSARGTSVAGCVLGNRATVPLLQEELDADEWYTPTIADVHTDPNSGQVLHVGVSFPNAMVISVQTHCATRAYVGPVFSYHEVVQEDLQRLTDEEWKEQTQNSRWDPDAAIPPRPEWTRDFIR